MLTVWRRHNPEKCKLTSRLETRCSCPIWVGGSLDGSGEIRKALKTRDWKTALDMVRKWELQREQPHAPTKTTVAEWRRRFIEDAEGRKLSNETIRKYKHMFDQLEAFATKHTLLFVSDFDFAACSSFRASWADGPLSSAKKLERLRSALKFAISQEWIKSNPARELKPPKSKPTPTLPYSQDEVERIVRHAESDPKMLGFIYTMLYAGLRISDAVTLAVSAIDKQGRLHLHTEKTGEAVRVPLPKHVLLALEAVPRANSDYYFWSGHSKVQSTCGVWSRHLATLFKDAKVANGHSHRFRDTFAVRLLEGGVSIENVAKLLGHASIRITEKHYAPWVRSRQDKLEAEMFRIHTMGIEF